MTRSSTDDTTRAPACSQGHVLHFRAGQYPPNIDRLGPPDPVLTRFAVVQRELQTLAAVRALRRAVEALSARIGAVA